MIPQHAENNQNSDHDHDPYSAYDQYGTYDVLVIGGTGVDTIVRVDSLPVPLADSVHVGPIEEWPGHTGGNVALGVRALGLKVGLLDCIGDDWIGAQVRERMAKGGVEFLPQISPPERGARSTWWTRPAVGCPSTTAATRRICGCPGTSTYRGCGAPATSTSPS